MNRTTVIAFASLSLLASLAVLACSDDTTTSSPAAQPDAGGVDATVPSTCTAATGPGTTHTSVDADETWTAAGSPHIVTTNLGIGEGRTVTIEPCAVVHMQDGAAMLVEGKLLAEGAADKPIRIERADASAAWKAIEAREGAELRFAYVTVEGGGEDETTLDIRGDQELPTQPIFFADHVTVKGSGSLGVRLREGGGFAPGSRDLTITGSATFPVSTWGRAVGTLPTGAYTGNGTDEIVITASGGRDDIKEDTTLFARGVPYRIGGPNGGTMFAIAGNGSAPVLTIEPGVRLRFVKNARLLVDTSGTAPLGALRAEGTADKPIVFESAEATPAAGDWVGIVIEGPPDARNAIAHAKISHAGGPSQISSYGCLSPDAPSFANEAAILLVGDKPASAFVTNTTIADSAGEGIVRGWTGDPVDFLPTNSFTNIARCNQTFPKPTVGQCPDPAPCPK